HDVLIAEGAPAETYLDIGNRGMFENAFLSGKPDPATLTEECATRLVDGRPALRNIWRALADRAGIATTFNPDLRLVVDGNAIQPIRADGLVYTFHISQVPVDLRIVSRRGVPAELGINHDRRQLGVKLKKIVIAQQGGTTRI